MSMLSSPLDLALTAFLLYAAWAVVLSDSRFHHVWSLALSLLVFLATRLFDEPLSTSSVPLALFVLLVLTVCIFLSPAQLLLFHTKPIGSKRRALKIFNPGNEVDYSAEFVLSSTQNRLCLINFAFSSLVSSPFMVLQQTQKPHGCLDYLKTTSQRTAIKPCGSETFYQRKGD